MPFFLWVNSPRGPGILDFSFGDHIQQRHTQRTPLDEWSVRHTELSLTTANSHKIETTILRVGFGTPIPTSEQPQTNALDPRALGSAVNAVWGCNQFWPWES